MYHPRSFTDAPARVRPADASAVYAFVTGLLEGLEETGLYAMCGLAALIDPPGSDISADLAEDVAGVRRTLALNIMDEDGLSRVIAARLARFDHDDVKPRTARFAGYCAGIRHEIALAPDQIWDADGAPDAGAVAATRAA